MSVGAVCFLQALRDDLASAGLAAKVIYSGGVDVDILAQVGWGGVGWGCRGGGDGGVGGGGGMARQLQVVGQPRNQTHAHTGTCVSKLPASVHVHRICPAQSLAPGCMQETLSLSHHFAR